MDLLKKYLKNRATHTSHPPRFQSLDINSPDYESGMSQELKKHIAYYYQPKHTPSHTAQEIQAYIKESDLLQIISLLERSVYRGIPLIKSEREVIDEKIQKSLNTLGKI